MTENQIDGVPRNAGKEEEVEMAVPAIVRAPEAPTRARTRNDAPGVDPGSPSAKARTSPASQREAWGTWTQVECPALSGREADSRGTTEELRENTTPAAKAGVSTE